MKNVKVQVQKYMRVVGYYGAVSNMNAGKKEEHLKRKVMTA